MSRYYLLNKYFVSHKRNCILIFFVSVCGITFGQSPNWSAPNPAQYNFNATMTAIIKLDGVPTYDVNDQLAVFAGNEIRGLSSAILIGNDLYFFVTIVSNNVAETMTIKYYNHSMDRIFTYEQTFLFQAHQIYGTIDDYLVYDFYLEGIAPLVFSAFPTFEALENCPISPIYLNDFILNRDDKSAIIWSVENNPDLILSLDSDTLYISGAQGFSGNTALTLLVNDTVLGGLMYALTMNVAILPYNSDFEWSGLPHQGIVKGDTFQIIDLDSFVVGAQSNGLLYDYYPIINESTPAVPTPNWFVSSKYPITMTVTTRINYTPKYQFGHPDDKLIAMSSSGQITGIGLKESITGLYFLSVGSHIVGDSIMLRFYSGEKKQIFNYKTKIAFDSGLILGNIDNPYIIDFAPIVPEINPTNECNFEIVDKDFTGTEQFLFFVVDTSFPNCLKDTTTVTLCIVDSETELFTLYRDTDGDGLGDPDQYITTCVIPVDGYVDNDDDCNDQEINSDIVTTSITEASGTPNDGFVCKNVATTIQVNQNALSYHWSTNETSSSINVNPLTTTIYLVTVTLPSGCIQIISDTVWVEGKVIKNSGDDGFGTLRNIVSCAMEGDIITFDIPQTKLSNLINTLVINKSITIDGQVNPQPIINIDFQTNSPGISIIPGKTLTLQNIDIALKNWTNQSTFSGSGHVNINQMVKIFNH